MSTQTHATNFRLLVFPIIGRAEEQAQSNRGIFKEETRIVFPPCLQTIAQFVDVKEKFSVNNLPKPTIQPTLLGEGKHLTLLDRDEGTITTGKDGFDLSPIFTLRAHQLRRMTFYSKDPSAGALKSYFSALPENTLLIFYFDAPDHT